MKKLFTVMFLLVLALVVASSGLAQGAGQVNGQQAVVEEAESLALYCRIRDSTGAVVGLVRRSNPWTWVVRGYWVEFAGGPAWTTANVTIIINHAGLPEQRITQHFAIAPAYPGITVTPFAITDWFGAAWGGNGRVIVDTSNGVAATICTCSFATRPF